MCGVIGQFCEPYFTEQPAKLQLVSFPAHPINLDIINILLTSFSQSVLFFSCWFMASMFPASRGLFSIVLAELMGARKRDLCPGLKR